MCKNGIKWQDLPGQNRSQSDGCKELVTAGKLKGKAQRFSVTQSTIYVLHHAVGQGKNY